MFKGWMTSRKQAAGDEPPSGDRYVYRASLVGSAYQFELEEDGLSFHAGRKSGLWPYASIALVRLSFRPVSMQSRRFRADIENRDGQRIVVLSTSWQTVALMAPQDNDYRAFILRLHERLAQADGSVVLTGGLPSGVYAGGVAVMVLLFAAMAALLVRALATGEFYGALFIVGFAAIFGWQIGGFIRRNRPRNYTFASLPKELLP